MEKKIEITTDNIFSDLGLEDSDEMKVRSDLMSEVVNIIRKSKLLHKEIAEILGIQASKVSALMAGKINDFSNDTLMGYLTLLGCNIEIKVQPKHASLRTGKKGSMKVRRAIIKRKTSKTSPTKRT